MDIKFLPAPHLIRLQRHRSVNIVAQIIFCSRIFCCAKRHHCRRGVSCRAFCAPGRRRHAGKILFRRIPLCAGGAADARAGVGAADAQSDASAARKTVDRTVDPGIRGWAAWLALSGRAVRIARDRRDLCLRPCVVRSTGAGDRIGADRFFQPDAVRAVADRDAGYFRARLQPVRDRGVHAGFSTRRPHFWFALAGLGFGLSAACKWSGLFALAVAIVIVAVVRLLQSWRTHFADASPIDWYRPDVWSDFRFRIISPRASCSCRRWFISRPSLRSTDVASRHPGSPAADLRRQHHERDRRPHLYSAWPTWPLLVRPVWYLFDKVADDRIAAIVFLGNPLLLWPALLAIAICLRDSSSRDADTFLILAFYLGS